LLERVPKEHGRAACVSPLDHFRRRTGLLAAIAQIFAASLRIRCWYHKMGNIRAKLRADDAPEVPAHVDAVRDAATYEAGCVTAAAVIERIADRFPSAMTCLADDDLEASLAHLKLPVRYREREDHQYVGIGSRGSAAAPRSSPGCSTRKAP
jgi:transposase-like protein